jgi:hypothetical protein
VVPGGGKAMGLAEEGEAAKPVAATNTTLKRYKVKQCGPRSMGAKV